MEQVEYSVDPTVQEAWDVPPKKIILMTNYTQNHKQLNNCQIITIIYDEDADAETNFFFFNSAGIHNPTWFLFN